MTKRDIYNRAAAVGLNVGAARQIKTSWRHGRGQTECSCLWLFAIQTRLLQLSLLSPLKLSSEPSQGLVAPADALSCRVRAATTQHNAIHSPQEPYWVSWERLTQVSQWKTVQHSQKYEPSSQTRSCTTLLLIHTAGSTIFSLALHRDTLRFCFQTAGMF